MPDATRTPPRHYPARDLRWLEQRGRTWYAVQGVPRQLRGILGKRKLLKSLGTRELHVAVARRHAALAEFQRIFDKARDPARTDGWMEAALAWRKTFTEIESGNPAALAAASGTDMDAPTLAQVAIEDQADELESTHGPAAADAFLGIAKGTATPLLLHVDAWLREGGVKGPLAPRTAAQYRADVMAFAEWARGIGVATIEAVTPAVAGRFVTEEMVQRHVQWASANRKITALSAYWRWLRKRAGVTAHPWQGQSLSKGSGRNTDDRKRPFTDAEAALLLGGGADTELADAMRVAALSGMRLEEIYRLTVADCADGWFRVRHAKTRAGVRRVPTHPDLAALVARRCAGKAADDFLMHEPGAPRKSRERSAALSKRFGRYRQDCGVHDRAEGKRHSRVDFHSWRRWFVTKARNAGIDRAVVAAVVGHEAGNLTDDVYSGGPGAALLRGCVESVTLPVQIRADKHSSTGQLAPTKAAQL